MCKKYFILSMIFLISVFASMISCTKDVGKLENSVSNICDTMIVSYQNHIKPITDASCAISGCHTTGAPAWKGDFTTYAGLKIKADNGSLRKRVIDGVPSFMPFSGSLSFDKKEKIDCWLKQGAPNN